MLCPAIQVGQYVEDCFSITTLTGRLCWGRMVRRKYVVKAHLHEAEREGTGGHTSTLAWVTTAFSVRHTRSYLLSQSCARELHTA